MSLGLNFIQLPGKEAVYSEGEDTFYVGISIISKPGGGHILCEQSQLIMPVVCLKIVLSRN